MAKAKRAPKSSGASTLRAAIGVVLFGGAALVALHDWLGLGGSGLDSAVNGQLYDAVVVSAGLACLLKAWGAGRERNAWLAISAAVFSWAAAEVYWTAAIADNPSPPYPSPADAGYLAFYPLAAAGLYLLVRARAHELDWRLWMDGLIATLGTAALGAAAVFELVADRTSGTAVQVATTLAYPLGDILMLSLVVGIIALTRWRPGRTWSLLLLGLAALVAADIAYTLQSTDGIAPGTWIEPIYLLAAACIGAEAWQPEADTIRPAARFDGWRELMVPGFFAAMMIGLFSLQHFSEASDLTTALWAATMLAVLTRLAFSVRENKRLLDLVKTDQLTGLGNQGRMQMDLETACRRAREEPVTLLLFDLNGFKRYNDTFGHPAGDAMLVWLGGQLRGAVGRDGTAYRIGGDEFAVLIRCDSDRRDTVAKRAAEALSAKGRHFEVGSSWGAVSIPAEAGTPAAAIQLADVRMYAQKESRRLADDDGTDIEGADVTVGLERPRDSEALEQGQ
ncbi:MAG: GGDEF domain-containing protein [Solirubrobacterales bacterium]